MSNKVNDKENSLDILIDPTKVDFIKWAEQSPRRCIIITDRDVRYEGFASDFEFIQWLEMVVPEKADILSDVKEIAAKKWEAAFGGIIPDKRRK